MGSTGLIHCHLCTWYSDGRILSAISDQTGPQERNWLHNRCIQRIWRKQEFGDIPTPPFWKAILPIILVIALTSFFQLAMHISAVNALIFGMWITAGVTAILHFDVVVHKITIPRALSQGTTEMFPFIMMSGCVFGFGLVAQKAACMDYLIQKIMSINVNPYLTAWLSVCLIAALCADGISGMTMWLGTLVHSLQRCRC